MKPTRRAPQDSTFNQARFASSPEFERGLSANLVAKRAAIVDDAAARELMWFVESLSHQAGGLEAVAQELITKNPEHLQTPSMAKIGIKTGRVCSADQVKTIRAELPVKLREKFLLQGENTVFEAMQSDEMSHADVADQALGMDDSRQASRNPSNYPAQRFLELCREEASRNLPNYLRELCLNPALSFKSGPWYFPALLDALREYQDRYIHGQSAGIVTTTLGQKVCGVLDYTLFSRGLTLMVGEARRGKSFAARQWCSRHPGQARFIEVPPGNDDLSFYHALASGLGLGRFTNYPVREIRQRVESVLFSGDLVLVLDEAQRLWPQKNLRSGFPMRMERIMAMANASGAHPAVPICLIATNQFINVQKAVARTGWSDSQFTGRLSHYELLPAELSTEDLQAVAQAVLPEANAQVLRVLATYARTSDRYLAAIDSISKRARYLAARAGRTQATSEDVRTAMKESVIPADTKLQLALEAGRRVKMGSGMAAPAAPGPFPGPSRATSEAAAASPRHPAAGDLTPGHVRAGRSHTAPFERVSEASLVEA